MCIFNPLQTSFYLHSARFLAEYCHQTVRLGASLFLSRSLQGSYGKFPRTQHSDQNLTVGRSYREPAVTSSIISIIYLCERTTAFQSITLEMKILERYLPWIDHRMDVNDWALRSKILIKVAHWYNLVSIKSPREYTAGNSGYKFQTQSWHRRLIHQPT